MKTPLTKLPIHKVEARDTANSPPFLVCMPKKVYAVIQIMLKFGAAVDDWDGVTCQECIDERAKPKPRSIL